MTLNELVTERLPYGKKRSHLGGVFVDGLYNFYKDTEKDLDDIYMDNFLHVIRNKSAIRDIKIFAGGFSDEFDKVLAKKGTALRDGILDYFGFPLPDKKKSIEHLPFNSESEFKLHDFQDRIRRQVIRLLSDQEKRFIIHMPTGSGKTRTAVEVIIDFFRISAMNTLYDENVKILWVAQSSELCAQAMETFKNLGSKKLPFEVSINPYFGNSSIESINHQKPGIIFASIQKLLNNYKSDTWKEIKSDLYLVVVDEAHRSVASQWIKALDYFVSDQKAFLIGLTATPGIGNTNKTDFTISNYYRAKKIGIMDESYITIDSPIKLLTKRNFLAKIDNQEIQFKPGYEVDDILVKEDSFEFSSNTLKLLSTDPFRNHIVVQLIKKHINKGHKILVFSCGVDHNLILKTILNEKGIKAESVDADTLNRTEIIERYKTGDLNVLVNFGVLTTGFDAPKTNVCIIARPIESVVMYSQMVGRILRGELNQGNKRNTLYTLRDNLNHGGYDELFNSFNQFFN
jgi:DNA repair protein RadD